ncbi:hypothetical protein LOZ51_004425 [Ophidiomyces ophidiicola]|nr:hypothetical protein LOZ51_004425 [Ophidiomyces ophidiicola]KAI1996518.1 hypothetical protein LOZ54_000156 [Ophidiomyces ophidiicola]
MDAVKTAYQTAEKVIFGETQARSSDEEPVSGVQGEGTASDPYDTGNLHGQESISGKQSRGTASGVYDEGNVPQMNMEGMPQSQGVSSLGNAAPGVDQGSLGQPVMTAPQLEETHHNQSRTQNILENESNRPHAGGQSSSKESSKSASGLEPESLSKDKPNMQSKTGLPANAPQEQTRPKAVDEPENTQRVGEEKIIRTTGFAAEGGNFDASEPGAGKEAERLLEEQQKRDPNWNAMKSEQQKERVEDHHGGLWTGSHKSGISLTKAKEKLHLAKHK